MLGITSYGMYLLASILMHATPGSGYDVYYGAQCGAREKSGRVFGVGHFDGGVHSYVARCVWLGGDFAAVGCLIYGCENRWRSVFGVSWHQNDAAVDAASVGVGGVGADEAEQDLLARRDDECVESESGVVFPFVFAAIHSNGSAIRPASVFAAWFVVRGDEHDVGAWRRLCCRAGNETGAPKRENGASCQSVDGDRVYRAWCEAAANESVVSEGERRQKA